MAQEKPSTLLAAQVWVADQRSRWNDLASLHLADIDLLLDKQLKWVNDHSDIDTLLSTLTIWADPSNEHTVKKPVTAVDRQSISDFNEKHKFPPEEHNITSSHNQSSVHCIELPEHPNSLTSTASPKPIPIIPEPTHTSDEKSSLIDDNIFNVTKDVKIPQIANSLTTRTDDDIILPTREHSVLAESKEIGQPYVFNDDYNNELSVELIVNTLDNEPQSNHDTKSVDEDDLMVDIKKQESEENNLQHSLMEESIELDERPGIDTVADYPTHRESINVARQERDPDIEVSEISTKDNSHKLGSFFSDIQITSHNGQGDKSKKMSQTMKPIFIEDSPNSVKHLELENKNTKGVEELKVQKEENDKFFISVNADLSIEESDIQQPVPVDDNTQMSSLHELEILPENEVAPATDGLRQQKENASYDDDKHHASRSPPKRLLAEMLSPSPDIENIRPGSPPRLNKVIENTLSPRNKKDDIMTSNLSNRPSDMLSPKSASKSASKPASPLKDVQNVSHNQSPTKDDEKHTSSSLWKYVSSNEVSPVQNIENIEYVSPPSRNEITPEGHDITSSKSDYPTSLGSADHKDDEDDMDEVILVGAENSTKWTRPAQQRISKMPAIQKDRHSKPTATKPEQAAKSRKEQVSGRGKADSLTTSKSQTKSLSLKKQKVPHNEKAGLLLEDSKDSNVVSLAGNKQIAKRETGISASKISANGESAFMKRLLGAYQDEKNKSVDEEIPLDKLERGLDEVLQDVNRNSLEVNKSLCTLDENRDYLHTKRDIGRQRHYMSPTVSRLKRLQVQETHQKLQSKLLAAQSTPRSMFNNHEKNNAKTKLTGATIQSHMSNSKTDSEHHSLQQQPKKKRLGILNGRNAERLKIVQQRRILQEKELVDGPNVEGKLTRSQESSQVSTKLTSSQSFAKATLSTQLKTHKPIESSSKAAHNFYGTSKPQLSTASWSNETQTKQKPLDISHRNQQAHSQPKQTNQDINNKPHQILASNQDGISIPNTTTSDKNIQEEDPRPRKRAKLPMPGWAMSPELKQALEAQCTLNPEEIFGKMAPLRIEEIFSKGKS